MKKPKAPNPRFILARVALVLFMPLLAACEEAEAEYFLQLAVDWAVAKGFLSLNCSGPDQQDCEYELNQGMLAVAIGIGRGKDFFAPDPAMRAALDAGDVVLNQETADDLVELGAANGDLSQIDQAIEMRPDDWSYRDNRGAVLLAQGNLSQANESFARSEALVQGRIEGGESCETLTRNMLVNRINALNAQLNREPNADLHDKLAEAHDQLAALDSGGAGSPCP